MFLGKSIGVVIPAYEEETLIEATVAGIPPWIDAVVVVDDASSDRTSDVVGRIVRENLFLVRHEKNLGVGAAITTGYEFLLARGIDVLVVMAGDNQMDPADLATIAEGVALGRADYVKGNRFVHGERARMPRLRRLGSKALALLTRLLSGLAIDDSQCGYTALAAPMARRLPLSDLWPRYGYPNDLLLLLAAHGARVGEVPVRPVYGLERSGLRPYHVLVIAWLTLRRALRLARGSRTFSRTRALGR